MTNADINFMHCTPLEELTLEDFIYFKSQGIYAREICKVYEIPLVALRDLIRMLRKDQLESFKRITLDYVNLGLSYEEIAIEISDFYNRDVHASLIQKIYEDTVHIDLFRDSRYCS